LGQKIIGLRIFDDQAGRFNLNLLQTGGQVLLVSNFTLHGDARKGRRPSFASAAEPAKAQPLLDELAQQIRDQGVSLAQGKFAAHMAIESLNDGPVNILLDSARGFC
jgi:D-tyrosyl-tRNA(Tyr) deacylase